MSKNVTCFVGAFMLFSAGASSASTIEGKISQIVYGTGMSPVRVSIFIDAPTIPVGTYAASCTPYYFAYENADSGIAKLWTAASMAAYLSGKYVTIVGTGKCDPYSQEVVSTLVIK